MIKFFRHIRQRMIKENRVTKYMLYAIGEIVLVMIGILLALQVNNWSKQQDRQDQEQKILNELLVNLRMDSIDHTLNLKFYKEVSSAATNVVESLEDRRMWNDTMEAHYGYLLRHGLATFNTSAYENLRSIGFNLISNDSIRVALTQLHTITYKQILKFEQELASDNQTHVVAPIILSRVRIYEPWNKGVPHDYNALLDDKEFLEVVRWKGTTMNYVGGFYRVALSKTSILIEMIERELNKEQ